MGAITKAFTAVADTAVDPDSPIDATLMTALRDRDEHMRQWMGFSFYAGAVQDHNHDGVNSALVPVGPNLLRNGSFEDGEAGWTFTDFTGGSHVISTSAHRHGAKSAQITSTVLANGGGEAISTEYIPVGEASGPPLGFWLWASVANVSSKVEMVWYDNAKALISASTVQSYTNTPTTPTSHRTSSTAPTNARWMRVRVTGGVPASGSATGTVTFEGIELGAPAGGRTKLKHGTVSSAAQLDIVFTDLAAYRHKEIVFDLLPATDQVDLNAQVSTNGGSSFDSGASDYLWGNVVITGTEGPLGQFATTGDSKMRLNGKTSGNINIGNAAGEGVSGSILLLHAADASLYPRFSWSTVSIEASATQNNVGANGNGQRRAAQDVDAFRLFFSTGNIASGNWALYGWN